MPNAESRDPLSPNLYVNKKDKNKAIVYNFIDHKPQLGSRRKINPNYSSKQQVEKFIKQKPVLGSRRNPTSYNFNPASYFYSALEYMFVDPRIKTKSKK